jgi:GNAT superfamily N-acetyltransferase
MSIEQTRINESNIFGSLVREHVSPFYPETEPDFGCTLLESSLSKSLNGEQELGNRSVWTIALRNNPVGFVVITKKTSSRAKIGPIVVAPQFRGKGLGRWTISLLERWCAAHGITSMYMTMPIPNEKARHFAELTGFRPLTLLRRQYSSEWDEVSLYKKIGNFAQRCDFAPASSLELKQDVNPLPRTGVEFPQIQCSMFVADGAHGESSVLYAFPKRGGAVKLTPAISSDARLTAHSVAMAEFEYRSLDRRKWYLDLPASNVELIRLLVRRGFSVEGRYAVDRDSYLLSKTAR